ncbi:uncharacterized protein LOC144194698 [Stigmatopora nigra]
MSHFRAGKAGNSTPGEPTSEEEHRRGFPGEFALLSLLRTPRKFAVSPESWPLDWRRKMLGTYHFLPFWKMTHDWPTTSAKTSTHFNLKITLAPGAQLRLFMFYRTKLCSIVVSSGHLCPKECLYLVNNFETVE